MFPAESQTGGFRGKEARLGGKKRGSVSLKWTVRAICFPIGPFCNTVPLHATSRLPPTVHSLDGRNSDVIYFFLYLFSPSLSVLLQSC